MAGTLGSGFVGRTTEREVLDGPLARVRAGESQALIIRGCAGSRSTRSAREDRRLSVPTPPNEPGVDVDAIRRDLDESW
jgi:hypothetical protein